MRRRCRSRAEAEARHERVVGARRASWGAPETLPRRRSGRAARDSTARAPSRGSCCAREPARSARPAQQPHFVSNMAEQRQLRAAAFEIGRQGENVDRRQREQRQAAHEPITAKVATVVGSLSETPRRCLAEALFRARSVLRIRRKRGVVSAAQRGALRVPIRARSLARTDRRASRRRPRGIRKGFRHGAAAARGISRRRRCARSQRGCSS